MAKPRRSLARPGYGWINGTGLMLILGALFLPASAAGQKDQKQSSEGVESVPDRLTAQVWIDRSAPATYQVGDSLVVSFRTSVDAFVTIYSISPDGKTTRLFPNRYQQDNSVRGDSEVQIPARGYKLQVTGPPGAARLELYASTDSGQKYRHSSSEEYERVSERQRESVSTSTQSVPGRERATDQVSFQIVAPPPQAWRPDEDFVERCYESLLGRRPTYSETSATMRSLSTAQTGAATAALIQRLLDSDEHFVRSAYRALLGREAESAGLQGYLRQLSTNQMSRSDVVVEILTSKEFQDSQSRR